MQTGQADHHRGLRHTDVANGPTQSLNPKVKSSKRTAHGSRDFGNYRLRGVSTTAESTTTTRHHGCEPRNPGLVAKGPKPEHASWISG